MGNVMIPPFRLYGLIGCPHCVQAEQFFRTENIPVMVIVGNDDPIAEAGVRWAMQVKNPSIPSDAPAVFPMLVCTFGKQIIEGWKEDEYRKLADAYRVLFNSASASDAASSGQQLVPETPTASPEVSAGAN